MNAAGYDMQCNKWNIPARSQIPRVMIAAPRGRSGKTVLTLGLLRAFRRRGIRVQPFKKGPDYIDPGWHSVAASCTGRNLDCFFMTPTQIGKTLLSAAELSHANLCLIEGAMGLYDGLDVQGSCSSAEIAKITATPVILVLDVTRMTRTSAAVVLGCCEFDKDLRIAGIILNKVRGPRQRQVVTESIQRYCNIPVLGSVPSNEQMSISDRHLGLITSGEAPDEQDFLDGLATIVEQHVNLDAIHEIAASAQRLQVAPAQQVAPIVLANQSKKGARIAVIRDRAFSFYYPENLCALQEAGARLVFADSIVDKELPPNIDGLYIGGGFPEVFAKDLQNNVSFKDSVLRLVKCGMPVYAECGGLMYLGRQLSDSTTNYNMVGALDFDTCMCEKQQGHGYACALVQSGCSWLRQGMILKGHEHHHSRVINLNPLMPLAFQDERGRGIQHGFDGVCFRGIIASYLHVNAIASPEWAPSFVAAASRFHEVQAPSELMACENFR